jgi:hypothetical protein
LEARRYQKGLGRGIRNGQKNPQEVSDDIRYNNTERIYISVFLEEVVKILKVGKRLRYVKPRAILAD